MRSSNSAAAGSIRSVSPRRAGSCALVTRCCARALSAGGNRSSPRPMRPYSITATGAAGRRRKPKPNGPRCARFARTNASISRTRRFSSPDSRRCRTARIACG
ncbi:hypothetical protein BURPSS13_C0110 [Burkholderia pseudomallei S13]|nr:hypothetical protein BURPSS13_C0110 [Burkholderia pseudomallei S13]